MTFVPFAADVPTFVLPARGLLIEGQRTNSVPNPRGEGAIAGVPGTLPTGWVGALGGIPSRDVVGVGVEFGLPYVDIRFYGTPTSTTAATVAFAANNGIAAVDGQTWSTTHFARIVGGTQNAVNRFMSGFRVFNGGTVLTALFSVPTLTGALQRVGHTGTIAQPTCTGITPLFYVEPLTGAGDVDVTVRLYTPQAEQAGFSSSVILPPVGAPGAALRGTDRVFGPLSGLGISPNGACTILWRGVFDATAIGTQQTIAAVDDGSGNRYEIRLSGRGLPEMIRVNAGTPATQSFGGAAVTPGAVQRAGVCIDGAGRVAAVFAGYNGGAALNVTGGPTSGLTTFRHGTSQSGFARELWGTTHRLQVLPRVVSDADLAALVASF